VMSETPETPESVPMKQEIGEGGGQQIDYGGTGDKESRGWETRGSGTGGSVARFD
jgi:hypothetical protein